MDPFIFQQFSLFSMSKDDPAGSVPYSRLLYDMQINLRRLDRSMPQQVLYRTTERHSA